MQFLYEYSETKLRSLLGFIDYMATKNVQLKLEKVYKLQLDKQVAVLNLYLIEQPMEINVLYELAIFHQDPMNPRYLEASWQDSAINAKNKPLLQYESGRFYLNEFIGYINANAGLVTLSVLTLNVVLFLLSMIGFRDMMLHTLLFPESSAQWLQCWRLLTPAFLHIEPTHLLMNLVIFWFFIGPIECNQGQRVTFGLIIFSALIANFSQYVMSGPNFLGLSGVVYAGLGYRLFYSIGKRENKCHHPLYLQSNLAYVFIIMMLINLLQPLKFFGISIGNAAHIGGLISGFIFAFFVRFIIDKRRSST